MNREGFCLLGPATEQLETFGWDGFFEALFRSEEGEGMCPARVASDLGESYRLLSEHGELRGELTGRLRHKAQAKQDLPGVGDWVIIKPILEESKGVIQQVLPRKSCFIRKEAGFRSRAQIVCANVDTTFVVVSLNDDFNLRRIERYVTAIWDSGSRPVIVLSKSDLCEDADRRILAVESVARGVSIHAISSLTGEGMDYLAAYLAPGSTVAMVGSSGAGKSTLINKMVGSEVRRVREIRSSDDHGRHATSTRDLILLSSGALVLDTPGMRELQLWDAEEGFRETFDDVESLAAGCRFSDCSHNSEPGCAIREALEQGLIDQARIESFEKIRREVEYFELRQRIGARRAEKKRWKKMMGKSNES
jgi:ribosome biogenesis GTPase